MAIQELKQWLAIFDSWLKKSHWLYLGVSLVGVYEVYFFSPSPDVAVKSCLYSLLLSVMTIPVVWLIAIVLKKSMQLFGTSEGVWNAGAGAVAGIFVLVSIWAVANYPIQAANSAGDDYFMNSAIIFAAAFFAVELSRHGSEAVHPEG